MSAVNIYIVDAFSSELFAGNPAAVCCLDKDMPDHVKQKIAAEMNLSETAFAITQSEGATFNKSHQFGLRWFTPSQEVDLCGHATLATAAVIFQQHENMSGSLEFQTRSGLLKARREPDQSITLDFPANPPSPHNSIDLDFIKVVTQELHVLEVQYSCTTKKLLIRLIDDYNRSDLESLKSSTQDMVLTEKTGLIKGVIVTLKAKESDEYDFYSRYFAPWVGIPEDPVTGSAHTVLGPYWQNVLQKNQFKGTAEILTQNNLLNIENRTARQCSKRGGDLTVRIANNRVELTGNATLVLKGSIRTE